MLYQLRQKGKKVDAYHKISINNLKLKVHKAPLRSEVELRIYPDEKEGVADISPCLPLDSGNPHE